MVMDRREQDHREISEIQDILTHLKDCSNNTIDYVIMELVDEKNERREQARQSHEIDAGN